MFNIFLFSSCNPLVLGYELWSKSNEVVIMNQLMVHGPLQVSMHLYDDFRYYKEGNLSVIRK